MAPENQFRPLNPHWPNQVQHCCTWHNHVRLIYSARQLLAENNSMKSKRPTDNQKKFQLLLDFLMCRTRHKHREPLLSFSPLLLLRKWSFWTIFKLDQDQSATLHCSNAREWENRSCAVRFWFTGQSIGDLGDDRSEAYSLTVPLHQKLTPSAVRWSSWSVLRVMVSVSNDS